MLLLSTGKSTKLSDFANLQTKSVYSRQNTEASDFRFYPSSNVFVEVHKNFGLELMRVKGVGNLNFSIQKIVNLNVDNVYCVACARQSPNEITLGLNNGEVWIFDHVNKKIVQRFAGEKRNSVVFVDVNSTEDYTAATHENGIVNIYGNKTSAKMQTVNIDSRSLLSRFHPTKRFALAILSHNGAVSVYDVGAKHKVFHSIDSHNAPCRDCSWSPTFPDTLISVGYDCHINIFDTRRKGSPVNLIQPHPLSTVDFSACGNFFCVGNLKGELATFDTRNLKKSLHSKKVHDGAVHRVAFAQGLNKGLESNNLGQSVAFIEGAVSDDATAGLSDMPPLTDCSDSRKSMNTLRGQRDSFCDLMDFQISKGVENPSLCGRDSFDWENLSVKPCRSNGASAAFGGKILSPIESDPKSDLDDSFDTKCEKVIYKNSSCKLSIPAQPLCERNVIFSPPARNKLEQIREDQPLGYGACLNRDSHNASSCDNNSAKSILHETCENNTPYALAGRRLSTESSTNIKPDSEIYKQIAVLHADMTDRFKELEFELKFEAERNKWQIFSIINKFGCKQEETIEDIRNAMMFLLQTDPFVQEFTRLKEENKILKEQIDRSIRKT